MNTNEFPYLLSDLLLKEAASRVHGKRPGISKYKKRLRTDFKRITQSAPSFNRVSLNEKNYAGLNLPKLLGYTPDTVNGRKLLGNSNAEELSQLPAEVKKQLIQLLQKAEKNGGPSRVSAEDIKQAKKLINGSMPETDNTRTQLFGGLFANSSGRTSALGGEYIPSPKVPHGPGRSGDIIDVEAIESLGKQPSGKWKKILAALGIGTTAAAGVGAGVWAATNDDKDKGSAASAESVTPEDIRGLGVLPTDSIPSASGDLEEAVDTSAKYKSTKGRTIGTAAGSLLAALAAYRIFSDSNPWLRGALTLGSAAAGGYAGNKIGERFDV